jgi:hypothetical protein
MPRVRGEVWGDGEGVGLCINVLIVAT